ncbi:unnamed protein product [Cyprideis torosa]|uniref:Uncharacterized protein n=1 Tax=Cyprideis torosa TaxID=163714 RepID=A0A7R8WMM1_9CRUS|nr:unnamed protein product [Cyprideis torosa]CAG0903016.1 unnamed protein product [Cyprideis torosa]
MFWQRRLLWRQAGPRVIYEGIDAVKDALRAGVNCSNEDMTIKVNLIAPPLYGSFSGGLFAIGRFGLGPCDPFPHKFSPRGRQCPMAHLARVVTTSTPERQEGVKMLQGALDKIEETIVHYGGVFNVKLAPKVVTDIDEEDLKNQMLRAEEENMEVGGDDDVDSAEEEELGQKGHPAGVEGDEEGEANGEEAGEED